MKVLVWDFGGPVLRTPFELRAVAERAAGLAPGTLSWCGPFDPSKDPDWVAMQRGDFTEREYWYRRGDEWATLVPSVAAAEVDRPTRLRRLMDALFTGGDDVLIRPESRELTVQARAAGLRTAVLTNDMQAFHGEQWVRDREFLSLIDVLVDGSIEGVLKPDPRIFELLLARLDASAGDCLFVDDQPGNIAGAQALGFSTVLFDPTDALNSLARVRASLALA